MSMGKTTIDHDDYLLKKSIFRIGEVSSVDGREVSVRVDQEKNRSHILYRGELLSNVSVGGYVKLIKGFNSLIGKIRKSISKKTSRLPNLLSILSLKSDLSVSYRSRCLATSRGISIVKESRNFP